MTGSRDAAGVAGRSQESSRTNWPSTSSLTTVYLKVIGSGDAPLQDPYTEPFAEFPPNRPPDSISKGDFLVLYAAGWKRG